MSAKAQQHESDQAEAKKAEQPARYESPAAQTPIVHFMLAYDPAADDPFREQEFGPDGTMGWAYAPQLKQLVAEAWESLAIDERPRWGCLILEGSAAYPTYGFPSTDVGQLRAAIASRIRTLTGGAGGHCQPIRIRTECHINVSVCSGNLVARLLELWQGEIADSSPAVWSQPRWLTADDPAIEEELAMSTFRSFVDEVDVDEAGQITEVIDRLDREGSRIVKPIAAALQRLLDKVGGRQFGSLEANQMVASRIQVFLTKWNLRLACPRLIDGRQCGVPSLIHCKAVRRTKHGSFEFRHMSQGRQMTHTGFATIPTNLRVVSALPDRRRKVYGG